MTSFGISDIAIYLPGPTVDLGELIVRRTEEGCCAERLLKAQDFTGQREMRIPDWYEDTVTMVAEATSILLRRPRAPSPTQIRHFYCGTETAQMRYPYFWRKNSIQRNISGAWNLLGARNTSGAKDICGARYIHREIRRPVGV